ncbi:hypothetical protein [Cohnella luojiensis]|uniref:Uncharacterized protein n=1 Tax=Cohnella luojiensis TaxID=652876 RepID=A0A4Y8LU57_9BACL|nr:hypothetical protein [Cohnella luojiensis]TFE25167.1 hypothetical protein E2980_14015 [Cohnella luojiensis]
MKKALASIILTFLIVGCDQQQPFHSNDIEIAAQARNESGVEYGKLINGRNILKWTPQEIYEKTGYPAHSGKQLVAFLPQHVEYGPVYVGLSKYANL